jgi:hypothetical protein
MRQHGVSADAWTAEVVREIAGRAQVPPQPFAGDPFMIGLVLGLVQSFSSLSGNRTPSRDLVSNAQARALTEVFGAGRDNADHWPAVLRRVAQSSERGLGLYAGKAITQAAFDVSGLDAKAFEVASVWVSSHEGVLLCCLEGGTQQEQFSYALREALVIERLAPRQALPATKA